MQEEKEIKDDFVTASAITNAIEQILTTDKASGADFFNEVKKNVDTYEGMSDRNVKYRVAVTGYSKFKSDIKKESINY